MQNKKIHQLQTIKIGHGGLPLARVTEGHATENLRPGL